MGGNGILPWEGFHELNKIRWYAIIGGGEYQKGKSDEGKDDWTHEVTCAGVQL